VDVGDLHRWRDTKATVEIRSGAEPDLERINEIYNHYVRTTPITFDLDEITMEQRREWLTHYETSGRYRLFVAADQRGVLGYATSSPLLPRRAYETSVTTSVYCAPDATGEGVGSALYRTVFEALEAEDVHRAYAGITMPNDASVALHVKFGFRQAGYYREQGRKFERYWDVAWYEKEI
jgi:phosphinothricin acetyltransferase